MNEATLEHSLSHLCLLYLMSLFQKEMNWTQIEGCLIQKEGLMKKLQQREKLLMKKMKLQKENWKLPLQNQKLKLMLELLELKNQRWRPEIFVVFQR